MDFSLLEDDDLYWLRMLKPEDPSMVDFLIERMEADPSKPHAEVVRELYESDVYKPANGEYWNIEPNVDLYNRACRLKD